MNFWKFYFYWKTRWTLGHGVNQKKWPKNIEIFVSISKFLKIPKSGVCKPNHEKFRNFILRIFLETKPPFSLFFTLHNFALSLAFFWRFFNIHPVKLIQKSLNYSSHLDSIVFDRCRSARARVSIFDEFRNFFRGNFEKSEKFRNGERRKFRNFIFFFGLHRGLILRFFINKSCCCGSPGELFWEEVEVHRQRPGSRMLYSFHYVEVKARRSARVVLAT